MSLLGIDIGTGSCKAVAFTNDGVLLARAVANYQSQSETDAERFYDAAVIAARSAAAQAAEKHDPVTALAISSHGETFVPVDASGNAVGPAVLNSDNSAQHETERWRTMFPEKHLREITGVPLHAMFPMCKIPYFRRIRPEMRRHDIHFLCAADYVLNRFGMPFVTDYSLAGRTMGFDINRRVWSEEVLAAAEIAPEQMPEAVQAGTLVGKLSAETARLLGLEAGVAVTVAGHDQPCGAFGAGAVHSGIAYVSAGTYECTTAVSTAPAGNDAAQRYFLNSGCHVVPGLYITLAFFPAGLATRYFDEQFCGEDRIEAERQNRPFMQYLDEKTIAACSEDSEIFFTPHLIGTCNPEWDVRATGAICGITPNATRYHLRKALYQGIACELSRNINALEAASGTIGELRIGGNNAKAPFTVQMRADFTGKTLMVPRTTETVALGAAMLAGVASGVYNDYVQAAEKTVSIAKKYEPDDARHRAAIEYRKGYERFYYALEPLRCCRWAGGAQTSSQDRQSD